MSDGVVVLYVDDDRSLLELGAQFLEREDPDITVHTESDAESGLEWLRGHPVDCVVSDYEMPDLDGLGFLEAVRREFPSLPFVLFTGRGSEEIASRAISVGVTEYLQKGRGPDQFTVLANRVRNLVEGYRAETDLARRARQYEAVAELGRRALTTDGWESVADAAVACLWSSLDADCVCLLRWRPDSDDLLLVAGEGVSDDLVGNATVPDEPTFQCGFTHSHGRPIRTVHRTEDRFDPAPFLVDRDLSVGLSVAVGPEAASWGVITVHRRRPRAFSDDDLTFVQSVANVLAAAVDAAEAQRRLRESERRFRRMAELSPDPIFTVAVDGTLTYVSPSAEEVYGLDPEAMVGTHFGNYVEGESAVRAAAAFQSVLDGERVTDLELAITGGDGTPVASLLDAALVEEDGEAVAVQGFVRSTASRGSAG